MATTVVHMEFGFAECSAVTGMQLSLEGFLAEAACEFQISQNHLVQHREWVEGHYVPVRWTNILPPQLAVDMNVRDAVRALSSYPLAPEVCLNN
jgi:hypothetical protein